MDRLKKSLAALFIAALLLLSSIPTMAAEAQPSLCIGSSSLYAGNSVTLSVSANDLETVATMDFTLLYDADHFTLNSAVSTGVFSYADINTNTAGEVRFLGLATDGVSGNATIMTLSFTAAADAEPGTYPLTLSIGEIYSVDGQPCEMAKSNGALTVLQPQTDIPYISFNCTPSVSQAAKDDYVTFTFRCYSPKSLACGMFRITYDPSLLAYEDLTLQSGMQQGNTLYDVNSAQSGRVVLSYATDEAVVGGALFSVRFRIITEENTGATVTMTPSELYSDSGQEMNSDPCSASIVIQQHEIEPDYPDLLITAPAEVYTDETFTVTVSLEEGSSVASADFTISYDPTKLIVTEEPVSLAGQGQTLMVNTNYTNGTVKFSFIAPDGIDSAQDLISIRFRAAVNEEYTTSISASGRGVVDQDYHSVVLDYPEETVQTKIADYTVSFETGEDGASGSMDAVTVSSGDTYVLPECGFTAPEGKEFKEWSVKVGDAEPISKAVGEEITVTADTIVTAVWLSTTLDMAFRHSCSFNDSLTVNYYVPAAPLEGFSNLRLVLEKQVFDGNGNFTWAEYEVTDYKDRTNDGVAYKVFSFNNIAAKEMGDEIRAILYAEKDGITYSSEVDVYSVKAYSFNRLQNSSDYNFKRLLVDMLNYGAAAQVYFGYNTENLVNADLTEEQKAYGTATAEMPELVSVESIKETPGSTAEFYGKSVVLENSVELKYYMRFDTGAPADSVKLVLTYTAADGRPYEVVIPASEFVYSNKYSAYSAKLTTIAAKDMSSKVTAEIFDGDTLIGDVLEYSIESYAYNRLIKSTDENFKTLVIEMMKYGKSAENYFRNKN